MDRDALLGTAVHASGGPLRLCVAVRPGEALGLRLAGAAVEEIGAGDEAAAFRRLLADPEVGVLAVEAALLAAAPERLLAKAHARGLPVVLSFALPRRWDEADRGRAYVADIIRRAVGYGVKLTGDAPRGGPA